MAGHGNHCSFVLLAEFHIYEGAQLKYQFPQPLGVDEGYILSTFFGLDTNPFAVSLPCPCFQMALKLNWTIGLSSS